MADGSGVNWRCGQGDNEEDEVEKNYDTRRNALLHSVESC